MENMGGGRKLEEDKQEQWIPACVPGTYCSGYERAKGPGPHSEMRIIVCPQTSQQALATSTGYTCTLAGANPVRPCAQNGFDGTGTRDKRAVRGPEQVPEQVPCRGTRSSWNVSTRTSTCVSNQGTSLPRDSHKGTKGTNRPSKPPFATVKCLLHCSAAIRTFSERTQRAPTQCRGAGQH